MNYNDPNKPAPTTAEASAEGAGQTWEATKEKAGAALQTGERYIRDNPATSMLSVFGLGFALGLLVGWSVAHEGRNDYSTSARTFAKRWGHKLNLD